MTSLPLRRYLLLGSAAVVLLAAAATFWSVRGSQDLPSELENALQLRNLPPNQWVKYFESRPGTWSRQGHAGMAFDTRRGSLLIFGSDTHGEDWDNAVHEFQPRLKRWVTHYAPAGQETYRVDSAGRPVAGADTPLPWAMHTYDAIEYHPGLDALIVTSTTEHNPKAGSVTGITQQPTWIYDLSTRRWTSFPNSGKPSPAFFGGASAYDERRNVLVGYRGGIWELDAAVGEWRSVAGGHHDLHHTMVYDRRRGELFVFGDYRPTNVIWSYRPGAAVGEGGTWSKHEPTGDPCTPYSSVPVAYDSTQGVFVLVVDNVEPGSSPQRRATSASTYLYDPDANAYTRLAEADLAPVGMNYMMAWDRSNQVIFLVTGGSDGVVTVWAMRPKR
jgi:hypothetical protein